MKPKPLWQKIPFLLELFINGTFILLYSLRSMDRLPKSWSPELVNKLISWGTFIVPLVIVVTILVQFLSLKSLEKFFRKHIFSVTVFIPLVITWG